MNGSQLSSKSARKKFEGFSFRRVFQIGLIVILIVGMAKIYAVYKTHQNKIKVLEQIVERLEADSRVAEVLVTSVQYDEEKRKNLTTIKFLEYDSQGRPLKPKYFTFFGNVIQFQSLVVRFDDKHVRYADRLKGKSLYLFWKVFMLDGHNTQEFVINPVDQVPSGYQIGSESNPFEQKIWAEFWAYAMDPDRAKSVGIKNAQIEAPGTVFVPGNLYTIRIEHDGGLRIDIAPLPGILRGEKVIF